MAKTKKIYKLNKGGRVIASGGFGCVFEPALKCQGSNKRQPGKISKLMTERHATKEYEEINNIKDKLDSIPNYENYFLLNDVNICKPSKLTNSDLSHFNEKCTALPKVDITNKNINTKLDEIMILNLPNGGLPVDDYIYNDGSFKKLYNVHIKLVNLLKNGIIPMNEKGVYHCDIKDSNVLIDDSLETRLIDWGLSVEYEPKESTSFPNNWKNRPLQFNVPFSVIIFTDLFHEKYSDYLKQGGLVDEQSLRPFVVNYINEWMRERGAGHYKFINEIMLILYGDSLNSISNENKPIVIETEITMPIIVDQITNILLHYTKFSKNGDLNLRPYLNEVFIKNIDIWGFINIYYPYLELLNTNYSTLNHNEVIVLNQTKMLFKTLYEYSYEPIDINELLNELKALEKSLSDIISPKKESLSKLQISGGFKTRKNKLNITNKVRKIFKRKPLIKNFKNPIFLSLK